MQKIPTSEGWFFEIDYIRGIAILCLVLTHTMAFFALIDHFNAVVLSAMYLDVLVSFVVPVFIIVSGMVLMGNYPIVYDRWKFFKRRFFSVVPQYLVFSTLYIAITVFIIGTNLSLVYISYYYLTGSAYYHLWFFVLLMEFYILYPFLAKAYEWVNTTLGIKYVLAGLIAIQIIWNILILYMCDYTEIVAVKHLLFRRTFPSYIFYFVFGMYIAVNREKFTLWVRKLNPLSIIVAALLLAAIISYNWFIHIDNPTGFDMLPYMTFWVDKVAEPFLFTACFILIFRAADFMIRRNFGHMFKKLGKESFGIFLIHPLFMLLGFEIIGMFELTPDSSIFYLLMFTFTLTLSYMTIKAVRAIPGSDWVIGRNK
jgi:peptidoglycan/LPS O-acetylase OafA/YrhL